MSSRGNFEFIVDTHSKDLLQRTYEAINSTTGGPELMSSLDPNHTFMFTCKSGPVWDQIHNAMDIDSHSGFSYAWVMQNMKTIFQEGWDSWVQAYSEAVQKHALINTMF
jgi:hypothetical protein